MGCEAETGSQETQLESLEAGPSSRPSAHHHPVMLKVTAVRGGHHRPQSVPLLCLKGAPSERSPVFCKIAVGVGRNLRNNLGCHLGQQRANSSSLGTRSYPHQRPGLAPLVPHSPGPRIQALPARLSVCHEDLVSLTQGIRNWEPLSANPLPLPSPLALFTFLPPTSPDSQSSTVLGDTSQQGQDNLSTFPAPPAGWSWLWP